MLPCKCLLLNRKPDRRLVVIAFFECMNGADLATLPKISIILGIESLARNGYLFLDPGRTHIHVEVLLEAASHGLERTHLGACKSVLVDLLSSAARDQELLSRKASSLR